MDKTIEKFIRVEDELEVKVKAFIEQSFEVLDLDVLMQFPEAELGIFAEQLAEDVFKKFSTEAILIGIDFADSVIKRKTEVNIEASAEQTGKQGEVST